MLPRRCFNTVLVFIVAIGKLFLGSTLFGDQQLERRCGGVFRISRRRALISICFLPAVVIFIWHDRA